MERRFDFKKYGYNIEAQRAAKDAGYEYFRFNDNIFHVDNTRTPICTICETNQGKEEAFKKWYRQYTEGLMRFDEMINKCRKLYSDPEDLVAALRTYLDVIYEPPKK